LYRRLCFCLMSEPEVIENASAAKQETSDKALAQACTDVTVKGFVSTAD
jgi:hypothetical protein